jgi:hypothetical protein
VDIVYFTDMLTNWNGIRPKVVRLAMSNLSFIEIWCGIAEVNFGDLMKDMHELSSNHSHIVFCAKEA